MKLTKILVSILSAALVLVACQPTIIGSYNEIKVSSSYVGINPAGGSQTIELTTTGAFAFLDVPEWLAISPMTGGAGTVTVTFNAAAASATREAVVNIACDDKEQHINVIQMCEKVELPISSCEEVLKNGVNGKVYKVQGAVTRIANTQYGNWYINDGTGEVYIYGTLDKNGAEKNFLSLGIEVGDIVTCEGPRSVYGSDIELVNVTVLDIEKSLIKIEEPSVPVSYLGGLPYVVLTCKGDGVSVVIPEEDQSWLSVVSMKSLPKDQVEVTFRVEDTEVPRSSLVSFSTNSGEYVVQDLIIQEGNLDGSGTFDEPYTVDDVMKIYSGRAMSTSEVYISGIITSVKEVSLQYGNAAYYIADEAGVAVDKSLYIYRGMYLEGAKFTAEDQIAVGGQVVIKGVISEYKNAVQIAAGNQIVSYLAPGEEVEVPALAIGVTGAPTAYDKETPGKYTFGMCDFAFFNVACYAEADGLQFKKDVNAYVANITPIDSIKKIVVTYTASKDFYPSNLEMKVGVDELTDVVEPTTINADAKTATYDFTGSEKKLFKLTNTSKYTSYVSKIEIY